MTRGARTRASLRLGRRRLGRRRLGAIIARRRLGAILVLVVLGILCAGALAIAAEPSATPVALVAGGDPRSEGSGPGLVGSPLLVLAAVVALGVVTALVTVLAVRLSRRA